MTKKCAGHKWDSYEYNLHKQYVLSLSLLSFIANANNAALDGMAGCFPGLLHLPRKASRTLRDWS